MLTKEELLEQLTEIDLHPELKVDLDSYMQNFVDCLDLELVSHLLAAGASPSSEKEKDDYLFILYHKYLANRSLAGEDILQLMEILLKQGASPNRVIENNLRVFDLASGHGESAVKELLVNYGANPQLREPV